MLSLFLAITCIALAFILLHHSISFLKDGYLILYLACIAVGIFNIYAGTNLLHDYILFLKGI